MNMGTGICGHYFHPTYRFIAMRRIYITIVVIILHYYNTTAECELVISPIYDPAGIGCSCRMKCNCSPVQFFIYDFFMSGHFDVPGTESTIKALS